MIHNTLQYLNISPASLPILLSRIASGAAFYCFMPFILVIFSTRLNMDSETIGWLVGGIFVMSRFLAAPVTYLIKLTNWRVVTVGGQICASFAALLAALQTPYDNILLPASVCLQSAGGVAVFVSLRTGIAVCFDKTELTTIYANLGVAINIGVAIGPMFAILFLDPTDNNTVFYFAAALQLCGALIMMAAKFEEHELNIKEEKKAEVTDKSSKLLLIAMFFISVASFGYIHQLILVLAYYSSASWGTTDYAGWFFIGNAVLVLPLLPLAGRIVKEFSLQAMFYWYLIALTMLPVTYVLYATMVPFPIAATLFLIVALSIAEAIQGPISGALIPRIVSSSVYASGFSFMAMAQVVGFGLSSALLSLNYHLISNGNGFLYWLFACLAFGVFNLLSLIFAVLGFANEKSVERA